MIRDKDMNSTYGTNKMWLTKMSEFFKTREDDNPDDEPSGEA